MPCFCYDAYEDSQRERIVERVVQDQSTTQENVRLKDRIKWFEAALCALITELEAKGIANEVIAQASKSGLIGIMAFWEDHSRSDEVRLAARLHEFSEHEQSVLKRLLNANDKP